MLQYLDLSFNRIGARGVMRICEVMKTSRFMRQLHLAHNRCGPAAGTPRHTPVLHLIPHQPLFPSSHPIHTHQSHTPSPTPHLHTPTHTLLLLLILLLLCPHPSHTHTPHTYQPHTPPPPPTSISLLTPHPHPPTPPPPLHLPLPISSVPSPPPSSDHPYFPLSAPIPSLFLRSIPY